MKTILIVLGIMLVLGVGLMVARGSDNSTSLPINSAHNQFGDPPPFFQEERQTLLDDDVILGDLEAPITLVEFGDYQCTFCTRFFKETEPALIEKYVQTGQMNIVFRDFVVNGQESQNAAEAAACAAEQDGFWAYHDKLYNERRGYNRGVFIERNLVQFAEEIGLDSEQFAQCYKAGTYRDEVAKDSRDAARAGARGTPTFILGGRLIPGAQPLEVFEDLIQQELEKVKI